VRRVHEGWAIIHTHAKSGDAATISGYLGKSNAFDKAMAKFAAACAHQTEKDYAALVKAVRSGRIKALAEE
jgi:thiamine monophosphate kinase